eukprot:Blabericola_migrator_1__5237@NODE_2696_length_2450_cov_20_678976_g1667_i1_p2_GENE_NODE_2696_length_2450_cov_20_678976_g1667_i1NODE_2696_length_2450_cov_20_678976_g1667_i1_p2_ORF_typecomplete_len201_score30_57DUF2408/PF10303_9/1_1DUF2408/PF10303_9/18SKA1/PF07160_12/0_014SKA1/PF07160_12/2_6e03EzrA/PF06160_12/0_086TipAS/PF07739_13/0_88TipAS/PF07739_13/3_7e02APG6_N/PF17675_1/4_9e03APG6_N/PF17675_1/0_26_NODE_2696_length_2450_cov_20_678976_g1667_i18751477
MKLKGVQNEHCWQIALDFVCQQMAPYSKWPADNNRRPLADTLNLMCESTDVAKTQVQEFRERLKAETELHPQCQEVVDMLLERSQRCLKYIEKQRKRFIKNIDGWVKEGAYHIDSALSKVRLRISSLETRWNESDHFGAATFSEIAEERLARFKEALSCKGVVDDSWMEFERELADLNIQLETLRRANAHEKFLRGRRSG